jgi:formylglycine-generating enzyme required for sulfatase activity
MKILLYFSNKMKRRQTPIYSALRDLDIGAPKGRNSSSPSFLETNSGYEPLAPPFGPDLPPDRLIPLRETRFQATEAESRHEGLPSTPAAIRLSASSHQFSEAPIPEEMTPTDPPAPPPMTNVLDRAILHYYEEPEDHSQIPHNRKIAELAPGSTVGAPAPAPGLGYAPEASFPPQAGVEKDPLAAAPAKKEPSQIPREIVRLSAESCDYGDLLPGTSQDWVLVVHNDGAQEATILGLEGLPAQGFNLADPPVLPQKIPPQRAQALSIRFAPDSGGEKAATLTMTIWTQDEQILKVPLRGTGITTIQTPPGVYRSQVANSFGMAFVYIDPDSFSMGSPEHEPGRNEDETPHDVRLTQGFYLQATPVTQGQWQALMGSKPAFFINCGDECPVEQVTWLDCQEFIKRLNALEEGTYRFPTEAEWEYAARAGSNTAFGLGEITVLYCDHDPTLDNMGWYCGNSDQHTHPVALKAPNARGLYDMHGNVYEWCQDWYGEYPPSPLIDPGGPASGKGRVVRGGSWFSSAKTCRSASRLRMSPDSKTSFIGFRVLKVV